VCVCVCVCVCVVVVVVVVLRCTSNKSLTAPTYSLLRYTCGERVRHLMVSYGLNLVEATTKIVGQYPRYCAACSSDSSTTTSRSPATRASSSESHVSMAETTRTNASRSGPKFWLVTSVGGEFFFSSLPSTPCVDALACFAGTRVCLLGFYEPVCS
jgi:hypothetical protein